MNGQPVAPSTGISAKTRFEATSALIGVLVGGALSLIGTICGISVQKSAVQQEFDLSRRSAASTLFGDLLPLDAITKSWSPQSLQLLPTNHVVYRIDTCVRAFLPFCDVSGRDCLMGTKWDPTNPILASNPPVPIDLDTIPLPVIAEIATYCRIGHPDFDPSKNSSSQPYNEHIRSLYNSSRPPKDQLASTDALAGVLTNNYERRRDQVAKSIESAPR